MRYFAAYNRIAIAGSMATGAQLLTVRKAMAKPLETRIAHSAHNKVEQPEQKNVPVDSEQSVDSPAPAETALPVTTESDMDTHVMPSATVLETGIETTAQEIPGSQVSVPTAEAKLLDGFSIGLGETLLAIIIAGPFLFRFLKKRSHA